MTDPSRLWASASRLYGAENMDALWGPFEPVPAERLEVLAGGETITLGHDRFEVVYTPGHARHHVSYLHDSGIAFVGDTGGVRVVPGVPVLPPTPPPDIDLEGWHGSIERIAAWRPERLGITHFGAVEDPVAQLAELSERLDRWAESARTQDRDGWVAEVEHDLRAVTSPEVFEAFLQATPFDQSYAGLRRYWDKHGDA
jgi:glyoxylase-like metal-dependent hydrolase (beta-lactamase superfamily II)